MDSIISEIQGPLAWLTFNKPDKRNAISLDMWRAIPEYLEQYNNNPDVRVIILRGAGDEAFVAGADISEFKELRSNLEGARDYNRMTELAFSALKNSPKPVIAMIRGFCFGGGCAIALNCDLRIAATDAQFCIPPAKLGIAYGGENVKRVVEVVGSANAREMLITARVYKAEEARHMGLINQLIEVEDLVSFTTKYATTIANNAPLSIQAARASINHLTGGLTTHEEAENAMALCFDSEDYQEGYTAFLEKRKPKFKGE